MFQRVDDDLVVEQRIPFSQTCMGTTIEVTTLDGKKFNVKVPAGVQQEANSALKAMAFLPDPLGIAGICW